jgi:hypothetical protein
LQRSAHVVLRIYDMRGSLIGKYIDRQMKTGLHEFTFNGDNLASGYYYFKLTVDHSVFSGKMLLLK